MSVFQLCATLRWSSAACSFYNCSAFHQPEYQPLLQASHAHIIDFVVVDSWQNDSLEKVRSLPIQQSTKSALVTRRHRVSSPGDTADGRTDLVESPHSELSGGEGSFRTSRIHSVACLSADWVVCLSAV